ncbi:hypothetical protein [Nocardia huaxiensis]|uniref:Uncharacterized protein n=1 Tax=Nocardia huaxiensis TaxID=2755382 RepID=A0A7D6Z2Q9_9NOCA|nr:hypothetical protein [Nocardia huaxiensis]QLY29464.1 hypothetical protein H0264_30040 [Nocardia huaxiensis]UFS96984.1 hypothetical protein LPY97_03350 [Nocardia huaxiensis]
MVGHKREVVASAVQEILNYFGKCPICGHPARAWRITAGFDDDRVESQDVAECGGWCGWKGPVRATAMTDGSLVLAKAHRTIGPGLPSS